MLILTRRTGEAIQIGENVTVSILSINGNQVRIGINAPREVTIHREEIYKRIQVRETTVKASKETAINKSHSS